MELGKIYWKIAKTIEGKNKFKKTDKLPEITLRADEDILIIEIPCKYKNKIEDIKTLLKDYKYKITITPTEQTLELNKVIYHICKMLENNNIADDIIKEYITYYENTHR